jgi:cell division protein FtsN
VSIKNDYKPDSTWKTRRQVRYHGLLVIILVLIGCFGSLLAYISRHGSQSPAAPQPPAQATRDTHAKRVTEAATQVPPVVKPKYDFYKVLPQRQVVISKEEIAAGTSTRDSGTSAGVLNGLGQAPPASKMTAAAPSTKSVDSSPANERASQQALLRASIAEPATIPNEGGERQSHQRSANKAAAARSVGSYFIQAGSFRNYAEADRRKASIAFLGINARIEAGTGSDGVTLHRVRIGPFKDYDQVRALLQRLERNNIPSIPLKTN